MAEAVRLFFDYCAFKSRLHQILSLALSNHIRCWSDSYRLNRCKSAIAISYRVTTRWQPKSNASFSSSQRYFLSHSPL